MKKFFALILALLLCILPAMAESHEAHIFAPEGMGISLTMDDSWFHTLANNLYAQGERASSDPCEYSDLFLIYADENNPDGILLLILSNRLIGSDHEPDTHEFPALAESMILLTDADRELVLWSPAADALPAEIIDTLLLPYNRLTAHPEDIAISAPVPAPETVGFDGLYGVNAVDHSEVTADILAGKKLTMVNVWATYCNPCISEMPDLGRLSADYADKGVQIIGIVSDVGYAEAPDTETLAYANVIIDSTGANYLHLVPGQGLLYGALRDLNAVPTTYFLDEGGNILHVLSGSRNYDAWSAVIDELLASMP